MLHFKHTFVTHPAKISHFSITVTPPPRDTACHPPPKFWTCTSCGAALFVKIFWSSWNVHVTQKRSLIGFAVRKFCRSWNIWTSNANRVEGLLPSCSVRFATLRMSHAKISNFSVLRLIIGKMWSASMNCIVTWYMQSSIIALLEKPVNNANIFMLHLCPFY